MLCTDGPPTTPHIVKMIAVTLHAGGLSVIIHIAGTNSAMLCADSPPTATLTVKMIAAMLCDDGPPAMLRLPGQSSPPGEMIPFIPSLWETNGHPVGSWEEHISAGLQPDAWWIHHGNRNRATLNIVNCFDGTWLSAILALPTMTGMIHRHFPGFNIPVECADCLPVHTSHLWL